MATVEELRKAMAGAQVFGKGQYILLGMHELEVNKLFYKKTLIDGVATESIICEFKVEKTNNDEMEIGETRSVVFRFDKKGWLSRFKSLVLALIGVDPDGKISKEAESAVGDIYAALVHDDERVRLKLPENFMTGKKVKVEGIPGTIKNGPQAGKSLVDLKWTPLA